MTTTFTTSGCSLHGHPEVTVTFLEPPLIPDGERLILNHVEAAVARGTRFHAGETLAIGGHLLRFCERADGTLGVEEPEPAPKERWLEAVDRTVREVMLQKFVNESVGLELAFAPPRTSLLVNRCAQDADAVVLTRRDPGSASKGLSGWSLSCAEAHDHGEAFVLPLLALSALKPDLVPFLALPPETVAHVSSGPARVVFRDVARTPLEGSFLARRNERAARKT
ncbi:MAG: hypothetical protein SFW67_32070 [Myxococcaceae bacterium]|nr:hypothetical protein [Myxococcaceae bacterium]